MDVTQTRWENFTHIGCGWLQISVGQDKWALQKLSGELENFIVCNYAKSKDEQKPSNECLNVVDDSTNDDSQNSNEIGPPSVSSMSMDPKAKEPENLKEGAENPFLMEKRIDLSAISKSTLQEFINFVLPHLDDQQEQTILENLQSHGGIISVENLENVLLNMKIKHKKNNGNVENNAVPNFNNEEIENRSIFEDDIYLEEHEKCLRRYMERVNQTNISYYNSTTRTQVLTAICLEGIKCNPKQDEEKCLLLHEMCNQHINTSKYSFPMRVTLSECTLEDILCHLGHQTPVMCCQDKYSECVTQLNSDKVTTDGAEQTDSSFVIDSTDSNFDDAKLPISNEIIFDEDTPFIIQNPSDFFRNSDQDEDTLQIFQNYTLVIDDAQDLHSEIFREGNIQNIISGLNSNSTDYKIVFDPNSTVINTNIDGQEEQISNILEIVNRAIQSTLNVCSDKICIENQEMILHDTSPALEEKDEGETEMRSRKQATDQEENQNLIDDMIKNPLISEDKITNLDENDIKMKDKENSLSLGKKRVNNNENKNEEGKDSIPYINEEKGNNKNTVQMTSNNNDKEDNPSPINKEVNEVTTDRANKNKNEEEIESIPYINEEKENNKNTEQMTSNKNDKEDNPSPIDEDVNEVTTDRINKNKKEEEKESIPNFNEERENNKNSVQMTSNINNKENVSSPLIKEVNEVTTDSSIDGESIQSNASEKESSNQNSQTQKTKDEFSLLNIVREEGTNILADMFNVLKESVAKEIERKIIAAKKGENSSKTSVNSDLELTGATKNPEINIELSTDVEREISKVEDEQLQNRGENLHQNHTKELNLEDRDENGFMEIKNYSENNEELLGQIGKTENLETIDTGSEEGLMIKKVINGVNDNESNNQSKEGIISKNDAIIQNLSNNTKKIVPSNVNPTNDNDPFKYGLSLGASGNPKPSNGLDGIKEKGDQILLDEEIDTKVLTFGINDAMDLNIDQVSKQEGQMNGQSKIPINIAINQDNTGPNENKEDDSKNTDNKTSLDSMIDIGKGDSTKPDSSSDKRKNNDYENQISANDNNEQTVVNFGLDDAMDFNDDQVSSEDNISKNDARNQVVSGLSKMVSDTRGENNNNNNQISSLNPTIDNNSKDSLGVSTKPTSSVDVILKEKKNEPTFTNEEIDESTQNFSSEYSIENKQPLEQKVIVDESILNNQSIDSSVKTKNVKETFSTSPEPHLVDSLTDIPSDLNSENEDKMTIFNQEDDELIEKNKVGPEKAFENQNEHETLNPTHDSFPKKEIKLNNSSNSEEEIQEGNTDPKSKEEIKESGNEYLFNDKKSNEISKETNENQSSNSQIEMSLPSFGFNITFDQSKDKPILPESYNITISNPQSVISLNNDNIDGVSISNSADSTNPFNTLSKEDMIILNERSEDKIYTKADSKENDNDDDDEAVVTRKIVSKNNIPRQSDDIVNIIKDIVYEQISDSESEEDLSSSQNQLFQNNKPYTNRKRMRNSLEQETFVEEGTKTLDNLENIDEGT